MRCSAQARLSGRLEPHLHDDRRAVSRRVSQRGFLRSGRQGRRVHGRGPHRCGTSTSTRQSRRRRSRIASKRLLPSHRCSIARTAGRWRSRPSRPELLRPACALVAHPDDERYAALVGTTVLTPLFRRAGAGGRARARRAGQGHRYRDGLHVRRSHRRHVVAGARSARARRRREGRHDRSSRRSATPGWESREPGAANAAMDRARGTHGQAGARRSRRDAP